MNALNGVHRTGNGRVLINNLELYQHIVKNAPFGTYGDQAQFKIGDLYKAQGAYEESQKAYQVLVDEYPASPLVPQARYQIGYVAMLASKESKYSEDYAQRAIDEFQGFKENYPNNAQAVEAEESIKALRAKKAMTQYEIGAFYDKQNKRSSAKVYYQQVTSSYPETPAAQLSQKRLEEIARIESQPAESKFKFRLW